MAFDALILEEPAPTHGAVFQRPATSGEWRFVLELADTSAGDYAEWLDLTAFYAGDRYQRGADDYMGKYRASLATVQLQIDNVTADDLAVGWDILAPWGQDTTSLFGVDVTLDAGLLMRLGLIRVDGGVTVEWEPLWTGRVEAWGDASEARGQKRTHVVSVVDLMSDLANVPTTAPLAEDEWPDWFTAQVLPTAGWEFGVDIYGDAADAGLPQILTPTGGVALMDSGADPLGLTWRTLRNGKMVIHPWPWDTTHTERYDNPLLAVYPGGLVFSYSPDTGEIDYIADDNQQPFGVTRTIAGVLNYFAVTMPGPTTYPVDDPVSIERYGVRPFSATWILDNIPVVDDLLAARAFASVQALPLRVTLDHEGFWPALAIVDHLDPVTVIHQTNTGGLVVTVVGTVRNIVEERTWRGDGLLSWQSTLQIDVTATETVEALLPVESLAFVGSETSLFGGPSTAEFSWTDPVQPSITPTDVQYRVLGLSPIWVTAPYPGVGADGAIVNWLEAATAYTFQVRLVRIVDGVLTNFSPAREVEFTTAARILPVPTPGTDPGDTDVIGTPPEEECDDFEVDLQENDGSGWVTVDTFTGAELTDNGDGTFSLTTPIDNSFFNEGSVYRFRSSCDGVEWTVGPSFDPPDDWTDPCVTPPALATPPFDDAALLVYVPQVCAPDIIREAVSGLEGVKGSAFAEIAALLGADPNYRVLVAVSSPAWDDAAGGIVAYGECPQIVGATGDKSILARVNVEDDTESCVLFECAAMRLTATAVSGGGWRPGVTVYKVGSTVSLAGASVLDEGTPYYLAATHDFETGDIKLYVDAVEDNTAGGTDNVETIEALPIWRVGAPPDSWITDCAVFDRVLADSELPGYNPVFDPLTGVGWAHAYWAEGPEFVALGLADGAAVATWPDEIGTADLTQATSNKRPLYRASGTTFSLPCIDFDGSNDNLGPVAYSAIGLPHSVVVIVANDTNGTDIYFVDGFDATHRRIVGITFAGSAQWRHYAGASAVGGNASTTGKQALRSKIVSGTSDVLNVNGANATTATAGDQTMTGLTAGSDYTGTGAFFNGRTVFIGVYAGDVTADGGWASLVTWASTKYGVTLG